jgi:hypothetical protein
VQFIMYDELHYFYGTLNSLRTYGWKIMEKRKVKAVTVAT